MEWLRIAKEKGLERIVSIQNQYSLVNRTFEIGLSEIALREQVGLLAYSPLSAGALTGKYLDGARPEGARFTLWNRNAERYLTQSSESAIRRYGEIAKKHGLDIAQMALAYVASRPFVTSAIIGATTMDQLKTDIGAKDLVLSTEVLADIEKVYAELPDPVA
jgi:aryl-alcohol dehydrogenase-like predicted oxidoreductase